MHPSNGPVYSTTSLLVDTFHMFETCRIVFDLLSPIFRLLERVSSFIIFPKPYLLLLLCYHMLHPDLLSLVLHESSNISRIPQLTGNTKIFTAAHQRIRFAALGRGGYSLGGEIILFPSCNRNQSADTIESAAGMPLDAL
jgi:hypothetical protein